MTSTPALSDVQRVGTHARLEIIREVAALERAALAAPNSATIRRAVETAWSFAFESCRTDAEHDALSDVIRKTIYRDPCETCGGVGELPDWQSHGGADQPEPITKTCPDCCVICEKSGRRIITETHDVPTFSDDDDWSVVIERQEFQRAVYCECAFGESRRERDERNSL